MRKLLLIPVCAIILFACKEKTASSGTKVKVDSAYLIGSDGLGELKMGMRVNEVEKALNSKITLMNKNPEEVWVDSAEIQYKDEPVTIYFDRRWKADDSYELVLGGIKTTSDKVKTSTGIGVGSDKEDIWAAYRDGYDLNLYREFEDSTYSNRSKTKAYMYVTTGEGDNALLFSLNNNKVYRLELSRNYNDEE